MVFASRDGRGLDELDRRWGQRSRTAIPGSSLPSRNSRLAPPPVEMWPKAVSSKPSWRTAAAESPPPTTDSPSTSVSAWATARVPSANAACLEHAHRAVPEDRLRVRDRGRERLPDVGPDVEAERVRRDLARGYDAWLRLAVARRELGVDHDVGRQHDLHAATPRPARGSRARCRAGPPRAGSCRPRGPERPGT